MYSEVLWNNKRGGGATEVAFTERGLAYVAIIQEIY
jgi:hypothetical protein